MSEIARRRVGKTELQATEIGYGSAPLGNRHRKLDESFCHRLVDDPFATDEPSLQSASDLAAWQRLQTRRALGITEDGYLLQGPLDCSRGHEIFLVQGARVPFIRDEKGKLVGECRVERHMDGKAWENYIKKDKVGWLHFK